MSQTYITGLDIGDNAIKAVVAGVKKDGQLSLIKVLKYPSGGMKRGSVDDFTELIRALNQVFAEIKSFSRPALRNIFLNIGSADINAQTSRGIVAVSRADFEITKEDMERVVQASQALKLPPNRAIIHIITKEYVVDGVENIRDPLGMVGNRLEVNSLILDAFGPAIKDLTRAVEMAGGTIGGLVLAPLADARSVLSKNQKDLGVVLIDIGFGTTSMCVYEENKLLHAAVMPVGAGNITNDIAIGLRIPVDLAETVKMSFGSASSKGISARESVDLKKIDSNSKVVTTRKFIAEITEDRLAEIFEFVNNELKVIDKLGKLPGGAVLVGGGSKMPGIIDLARQELRLPVQLGIPDSSQIEVSSGELNVQIEDPEFSCALGLVFEGSSRMTVDMTDGSFKSLVRKIKSFILP
ncbi:MAG: cell division protein FtsA [Candidatus Pacebacteria bacterium]|nr:cell division protein FtsA [Candidatus Paceibacterota bacterium]